MPGKKRPTSAKQSALSKRHKTSAAKKPKKRYDGPKDSARDNEQQAEEAPKRKSAFPADKARSESDKKDRKGKGPAYIEIREDQAYEHSEGSGGEMDIDDDLNDLNGQGNFLANLDTKGMAASRVTLAAQHRKEKPAPQPRVSKFGKISIPEAGPTKSELKAAEKKEKARKKALRKGVEPAPDSDEDDVFDSADEGGEGKTKKQRKAEGELLDDLEEDDLAFGSGGSDDELSTMSEWDSNIDDMSDMSDMSDLDSLDDDEDDEDEEGLWSDEDGSAAEGSAASGEVAFDDDEAVGSALESPVDTGSEGSEEDEEESEEDDEELSEEEESEEEEEHAPRPKKKKVADTDDLEAAYAARPKKKEPKLRPTKLPTLDESGRVVRADSPLEGAEFTPSPSPEPVRHRPTQPEYRSDPLGQRFGRPAIRQLLEIKDKKERIARAREEIADLGREASGTGEGEGGLNLLKRLLSMIKPKFSSSSSAKSAGERPISIDREVRIMAMVSLLAVFNDIVPGYRIRPLTEAEKEVKVSQMVARQREWEDGLVGVYKNFLEVCEAEVSEDSKLATPAIHCLCTLAKEKSEFNFAVNIMDVVVKRLGRKGWDDGHQLCLATVVHLLQTDTTTTASNSLHIVRLISRLVRARSFAIRPEVLSALLHLRLKDELGGGRVRASTDAVFREREGKAGVVRWNKEKDHKGRRGGKAKAAMTKAKAGSKKSREVRKERNAIEKEMAEAEGEVDQEERERNMTETLKLLFALYFRIVKLEYRTPLLPAALEGLARFAHLVNVDFFRDLLEVLKLIIQRGGSGGAEEVEAEEEDIDAGGLGPRNDMREKLLCVVTAFELLQGQGEALNIDLGDFVSALYAIILPLALSPTFEETPYLGKNALTLEHKASAKLAQTEADLLFRALAAIFLLPRSLPSPIRTLAFSKRLMTSCLQWPPASQLRTLVFLRSLVIREPKLEAMLETGDRRIDGRWKGQVDEPERAEPESTCWWEAGLFKFHPDEKVRQEAKKLLNWVRD